MELTGRRSELAALTAELDALRNGRGRVSVLSGERGAGKTALAEAFAAEARNASVRVLWMAGRALTDRAPSWPWPAIVRELGGGEELVDRLHAGDGGARLFEDVAAVLAREADRRPLVLVVDDGDVLDKLALDLLVFVAEQLRFRPLVVVVTTCDRERVEPLCRAASVIVLQGLGARSARELLERTGVVLPDDVLPAVLRITGGLPGELIDLARELSTRRVADVDEVFEAGLALGSTLARTQGRATCEALVQRLVAARALASPRVRGEIALFVHRLGGVTSTTADDRVGSIREALRAIGEDDGARAIRAQLHAALARELYHGDVLREGNDPRAEVEAGLALARQSGDGSAIAWCLRARFDIDWRPGTATERLSVVDDIVSLLDGTTQYEEMADALLARFAVYLELGDVRVDREFDRFLQIAARDSTPRLRHLVLSRRAMRALMAGDLPRAEELIEAAAASARRSGEPDGAVVALNQRFELSAERGDRSSLLPILERFRGVSSHPAIVASLALARLDAGDHDGARSAVAPYEDASLEHLRPEYGRAWVLSMLGDVFVALGDRDAVRRTAAALAPFSGTNIVSGGGVLYRGAVDHHLGVLRLALDEADAGVAYLRAALEMHQRLGATRWARRTEAALGSANTLPRNEPAPSGAGGADASMVRAGDVWTLSYAEHTISCKDVKGLRDLATLLASPGLEIRATLLAGAPGFEESIADDVLDQRAREEIGARLNTLDSEIARADERGDQAASVRAGAERDALINELRVATGLGGRSRRLGDPAERARKAVSARMHDAIVRIERQHPELGRHLRENVVIGGSCRYQPDGAVRWVVRQNESGG